MSDMRQIPSLRAIQVFDAAARLGSQLRAAQELKITPSAVSHQIRALERELGVPLFHRSHRAISLTDAGRQFSEAVAEAMGIIEAATHGLGRRASTLVLTVHSAPSLASQWLMPRISRFSAANPAIDVRLSASGDPVDLSSGSTDFDIRYGNIPAATGVVSEPFPEEVVVALCSPALLTKSAPLDRPEHLANHVLIHSEVNLYRWRDWARDQGVTLNLERGPRFDRSFMALSAATDGLGVCLESRLLAERELESGKLVQPFGPEGYRVQCHSLNYLRSRLHIPKLAAFRRWLMATLKDAADQGAMGIQRET